MAPSGTNEVFIACNGIVLVKKNVDYMLITLLININQSVFF